MDETDGAPSSLEPPWWRQPKAPGRRRQPLTRDAIVDAAVRIVDAEGVDALTVRRLGRALDTGSATLYWHIRGKDELGQLVYDRVMGEVELPEPDPSRWEEQAKELVRRVYRVMLRHNDLVRLSIGNIPAGPNMLRIIEWMLDLLRRAGIPDQAAAYTGDIVGRYIDASVLEARAQGSAPGGATGDDGFEMVRAYFGALPAEQFPNILAVSSAMFTGDDDERFEFGLDLFVRGLAAYAEPPTTRRRKPARKPPAPTDHGQLR